MKVIKEYGKLPKLTCYANQFTQVFINLLNNAIDALATQTTPGVITIQTSLISKETRSNTSAFIVIQITDNCPGMSKELRQKIFDPFFKTKPIGRGTGLGLSISYQIVVKKHQGQIYCNSVAGRREFIVEMPVIGVLWVCINAQTCSR